MSLNLLYKTAWKKSLMAFNYMKTMKKACNMNYLLILLNGNSLCGLWHSRHKSFHTLHFQAFYHKFYSQYLSHLRYSLASFIACSKQA